ncbi:MAG: CinA family protein [Anaerolineaceae bacterium]|nr:CinA family protein [Anaerolineaceae bacterium]MBN2678423.1 CinA family protein [Anaerolineaceae bacterium]
MSDQPLEIVIGDILRERKLTLAVAESCTGGLLGSLLTDVPGSSEYFLGGIIAYAYGAKENLLGVRHETLWQFGAVSRETVLEMARGVRRSFAADIGVSITGIAGPGGGMPNKPVGLAWIGLCTYDGEWSKSFQWNGDRHENKISSARAALQVIHDYLNGTTPLD